MATNELKLWVGRDYGGDLYLYCDKPKKNRSLRIGSESDNCFILPDDWFPEVRWSDAEPLELVARPVEDVPGGDDRGDDCANSEYDAMREYIKTLEDRITALEEEYAPYREEFFRQKKLITGLQDAQRDSVAEIEQRINALESREGQWREKHNALCDALERVCAFTAEPNLVANELTPSIDVARIPEPACSPDSPESEPQQDLSGTDEPLQSFGVTPNSERMSDILKSVPPYNDVSPLELLQLCESALSMQVKALEYFCREHLNVDPDDHDGRNHIEWVLSLFPGVYRKMEDKDDSGILDSDYIGRNEPPNSTDALDVAVTPNDESIARPTETDTETANKTNGRKDMGSRMIMDHKIEGVDNLVEIEVLDSPGEGGACHEYEVKHAGSNPEFRRWVQRIHFQNGPVKENGCNGMTQECLLAIVLDRLRDFQNGDFACRENAIAITHIETALMFLQKRTRDRLARGVEGTNKK